MSLRKLCAWFVLACSTSLVCPAERAAAQCDGEWLPGQKYPGVYINGRPGGATIDAMVVWDRDGAGPLPPVLVLAGAFERAGGEVANHIAVWDGTNYSTLGTGFGPPNPENTVPATFVSALAVAPNGDLIAGGRFTTADGAPANNIARWNGTSWSALGDGVTGGSEGSTPVHALAVLPNGDIIAGGNFATASGVAGTFRVARWNGTTWLSMGGGMTNGGVGNSPTRALAVMPDGDVIVGGWGQEYGGLATDFIARWDLDTDTWSPMGIGCNGPVFALHVMPNGDLIAGGAFNVAGGVFGTVGIARWDGIGWNPMGGTGLQGGPTGADGIALMPDGDLVVVGGFGNVTDSAPGVRAARWNPATDTWSALGDGLNFTPKTIAVFNGEAHAGGNFRLNLGSTPGLGRIGRWDGTRWNYVGPIEYRLDSDSGFGAYRGRVLRLPTGEMIASGFFIVPGQPDKLLGIWNGTTWVPWIDAPAGALRIAAMDIASNGDLVIAAVHTISTDGIEPDTHRVYRRTGGQWVQLGGDVSTWIYAMKAMSNGDIVIGGNFFTIGQQIVNKIARWNGTSWQMIGGGVATSRVFALAEAPNGDLIAGGLFTEISGTTVNHIARWNGSFWSALGTGVSGNGNSGSVDSLLVMPNGDIIAGGGFLSASGVAGTARIARWNGSSWSPLGTGSSQQVNALFLLPNGDVGADGRFTTPSLGTTYNVGRWDGTSWSTLGTGVNNRVLSAALAPDGTLFVAGDFEETASGPAFSFARLVLCGVCCAPDDSCTIVAGAAACAGTFHIGSTTCSPVPVSLALVSNPPPVVDDSVGNGNGNGRAEPGESALRLTVALFNQRPTPGCDSAPGVPTVSNIAATLTSLSPTVSVISGNAAYPDMAYQQSAGNLTPFVIAIDPSHVCGSTAALRLSVTSDGGSPAGVFDFAIPVGVRALNFGSARQVIGAFFPDDSPAGVDVEFTVSDYPGLIADANFRIDGGGITTSPVNGTTGLGHANVGELVIKLRSPQGTIVTLANRPGGGGSPGANPSTANNMRTLTFDDSATGLIQNIGNTQQPVTGNYKPASPLAAFNGENPNGVWTLNVADVVASTGDVAGGQGGWVRHATLLFSSPAACTPPGAANDFCCRGTTCNSVVAGTCTGMVAGSNSLVVGSCGAGNATATCCFADFNHDGSPSIDDLFLYLNAYFTGSPWANVGGDGVAAPTIDDLFLYINAYFTGCA